MHRPVQIIGPELQQAAQCEAVLRSLPAWFGIEEALVRYARESVVLPTFATLGESGINGFLTLREHFPVAWEVHCIAIHADARGQGLGCLLLQHAQDWLRAREVQLLQVKTIAMTKKSAAYDQTRAFYDRMGFMPLEIFPDLWAPHNPCLQLVKCLQARTGR
jgi:ribosomal protein S18 acetylase RimI-like enzyme